MIRDAKLRIIDKEYGRENLKFTIYWRGPHPSGGSPHGMRLDITRNEVVLFEPARREVAHDFSDSEELGTVELDCYTLEEVVTEGLDQCAENAQQAPPRRSQATLAISVFRFSVTFLLA